MKLAISNIAWLAEEDQEIYSFMQNSGYTGLEIAPTRFFPASPYEHIQEAKALQQQLFADYHLQIVSMQSLLFGTEGLYLFTEETARDNLKAYLQKAILFASAIDCRVLVFGNPKNRVSHSVTDLKTAQDFFTELGDFAIQHNVILCLEPNPIEYGTNFMTNTEEVYQFIKKCNSPGFRMICDVGTMIMNKEQPEAIANWLDCCAHVHISAPFLAPVIAKEEYKTHYQRLVNTLKQEHYAHYLSIEMARPKDNTVAEIKSCMTFLKEIADGH